LTPVRAVPHSLAELVQAAAHTYLLALDNISSLSDVVSDALCRFMTGEGVSKRELYSDDDDVIYAFMRVVLLNGINVVAEKLDLLDRCYLAELAEIPAQQRRDEQAFWRAFEAAKPRLLGALLDALVGALGEEPNVRLARMPRMADAARWGVAASRALGWDGEEYLKALDANLANQNAEALEASPVAQAVLALMVEREDWQGTPTALLAALNGIAEGLKIDTRMKEWPKSPSWVGKRLREVTPNLRQAGYDVVDTHTGDKRLLTIRRGRGNTVSGVSAVSIGDADPDGSAPNANGTDGGGRRAVSGDEDTPGDADGTNGTNGISGDGVDEAEVEYYAALQGEYEAEDE
jgi:hypothetical protein